MPNGRTDKRADSGLKICLFKFSGKTLSADRNFAFLHKLHRTEAAASMISGACGFLWYLRLRSYRLFFFFMI